LPPAELIARLEPVRSRGELGTLSLPEVEHEVARVLALGDGELRALMKDVWTEYLGVLNDRLAGYFASLRPRYRTAILSNSFVGAREREQAAYGFAEICDVIVYSHEEDVKKPDERVYGILCHRLGVRADETLFLDDARACVEGARDAGMTAIQFRENDQAIAELDARLGLAPWGLDSSINQAAGLSRSRGSGWGPHRSVKRNWPTSTEPSWIGLSHESVSRPSPPSGW